MLTRALIDDLLACLDLWYVLSEHKGLLLLSAPAAVTQLQKLLCKVLDTIAFLPLEQSAIARLSTAPVDPAEAKLAEEPTTDASEALLGLQHFWFWVCSICRSGACSGTFTPANMPGSMSDTIALLAWIHSNGYMKTLFHALLKAVLGTGVAAPCHPVVTRHVLMMLTESLL